jgi:hypothetical protein
VLAQTQQRLRRGEPLREALVDAMAGDDLLFAAR